MSFLLGGDLRRAWWIAREWQETLGGGSFLSYWWTAFRSCRFYAREARLANQGGGS